MSHLRAAALALLALVLGGALVGLYLSNGHSVELRFLEWRLRQPVPLWQVMLGSALVGALVPWLLGLGGRWRRWRQHRAMKKRLRGLEREVVQLRNLPMRDLPPAREPLGAWEPEAPQWEELPSPEVERALPEPRGARAAPELLPGAPGPRGDVYAEAFAAPDPMVARSVGGARATEPE